MAPKFTRRSLTRAGLAALVTLSPVVKIAQAAPAPPMADTRPLYFLGSMHQLDRAEIGTAASGRFEQRPDGGWRLIGQVGEGGGVWTDVPLPWPADLPPDRLFAAMAAAYDANVRAARGES